MPAEIPPTIMNVSWKMQGTRKLIFWLRCVLARKVQVEKKKFLFLPQNDCQSWIPKWRKMDCEVERRVHTHRTRTTRYIQRPQHSNVSSKF